MNKIYDKNKVYIIAEAGVNHNGNIDTAKKMIENASKAGADCIKFQAFTLNKLVSKNAFSAEYQKKNTGHTSQRDLLKSLYLSKKEFKILYKKCIEEKIEFLCTAFDEDWLIYLINLGMKKIKIPSGEITNFLYLQFVAKQNLPIILSTGMSNEKEITNALDVIKKINKTIKVSILHCTSLYPAPMQTLNLSALATIKKKFNLELGYSDHSIGESASIASIGIGARIIEKHFTLNKNFNGPDHKASISSVELKKFVKNIRDIEKALGNGVKQIDNLEYATLKAARRSWHASKNIKEGSKLNLRDIVLVRPGNGILGDTSIIGMKVLKNIKKGTMIESQWIRKSTL